jgi:hypothetical protein
MAVTTPPNYAPVTKRSSVAHQPGQKAGEKIKTGRDYSIEFDDALLSQKGWIGPRFEGCEITGLHVNKFSKQGTPKYYGGLMSPNIQNLSKITQSWAGDSGNLDRNPVVEVYTNTIFFGSSLSGYQEDSRYPNVGEDFSYVFVNKAYTFDPHNDTFFITELLGPNDKVFERVLKQDLSYASKFSIKILDLGIENDLNPDYTVHWNAGLFSLIATYRECEEAPYTQEMIVSTQYVARHTTESYYGVPYNPIPTDNYALDTVYFLFNTNNYLILTGSFTVETNTDTWWWRRPRTSSYFGQVSPSSTPYLPPSNSSSGLTFFPNAGSHLHTHPMQSPNGMADSVYGFMEGLIEKSFTFQDTNENLLYGTPPGVKDLHILTFNDAEGCVKEIQSELRSQLGSTTAFGSLSYPYKTTTQALRHFGSITLSPGGKIPVPGCDKKRVDLGQNDFRIESRVASPAFNEYVVQSGVFQNASTNALNRYKYYTWFVGGNASASEDSTTFKPREGVGFWDNTTGSGNFVGAPQLHKFTISKLEKRPNVIMADINKAKNLFDGIGGQGFLCIPENLNPQIKNNLDYYLKKAELISKGPNKKNLGAKSPRILRNSPDSKKNHLS